MLTVLGIALGILVVLAITALTGYFVAQEFAYMAVDRSRLKARAEAGDTAAARALSVTRRTSFMRSGAQLGITVTGLLVGYVAEPLIGSGLGELLGGVGIPTAVGVAVGTVLAVLFSTTGRDFLPYLDEGSLWLQVQMPSGITLEKAAEMADAPFGRAEPLGLAGAELEVEGAGIEADEAIRLLAFQDPDALGQVGLAGFFQRQPQPAAEAHRRDETRFAWLGVPRQPLAEHSVAGFVAGPPERLRQVGGRCCQGQMRQSGTGAECCLLKGFGRERGDPARQGRNGRQLGHGFGAGFSHPRSLS